MNMSPDMMDMMKGMNTEEVNRQLDGLGLTPQEVLKKIMDEPELAAAFSKPNVMQAILESQKNPLAIMNYQNDPDVMLVSNPPPFPSPLPSTVASTRPLLACIASSRPSLFSPSHPTAGFSLLVPILQPQSAFLVNASVHLSPLGGSSSSSWWPRLEHSSFVHH